MPSSHRSPADLHALLHEKLDALLAESEHVMDTAQHGHTLHDLDDFFCTKGQEFLQEVFKEQLQERIAKTETTAEAKECPHCKKNAYAGHENDNPRSRSYHPSPPLPLLSALQATLVSC